MNKQRTKTEQDLEDSVYALKSIVINPDSGLDDMAKRALVREIESLESDLATLRRLDQEEERLKTAIKRLHETITSMRATMASMAPIPREVARAQLVGFETALRALEAQL